jgi:hypothetical protein
MLLFYIFNINVFGWTSSCGTVCCVQQNFHVLPFVDKFEEQMARTQQGAKAEFAALAISGELFAEAKEEIEKGFTDFTSPAGSSIDTPLLPVDGPVDGRLLALLKALENLIKHV